MLGKAVDDVPEVGMVNPGCIGLVAVVFAGVVVLAGTTVNGSRSHPLHIVMTNKNEIIKYIIFFTRYIIAVAGFFLE